jgi:Sap, sulfolipid-1-addressing protein
MELFLLALEAAIYPTLIAAVVILLAQPKRVQLLGAYLAGGLVISIGLGFLLVELAQPELEKQGSQSTLSWTTDLAVGGLVLLIAVALQMRADERLRKRRAARKAQKHPEPPPDPEQENAEPWSQRILSKGSTPIVFLAGLAINVPGAAYLVGLKDIAAGNHSTGTEIALIVAFNVIMFALAEIPLAGLIIAPEPTERLVERANSWFTRNGRNIAIVVCVTLGVYLIVRGIVNS